MGMGCAVGQGFLFARPMPAAASEFLQASQSGVASPDAGGQGRDAAA